MSTATLDFANKMFLDYYKECFDKACMPHLFHKREFGVLLFKKHIMLRHKKFQTFDDLHGFLCSTIPSDVYYSSAYYEQPDATEMSAKGWIGADLIFDIDADHLQTPCNKIHDEWVCVRCGFAGRGVTPEYCPACNGERFDESTWTCEVCLASAKIETVKLLDMLTRDFGFLKKDIQVFFSGHRGYHVHVEAEATQTLDAVARREIVDYVCGLGLDTGFQISAKKKRSKTRLPKQPRLSDLGWSGRLAKGLYDFILNAKKEDYINIGLRKNAVNTIMQNKNTILKGWADVGPYHAVKGVGFETWKKIAEFCTASLPANVDTVVTADIHRLIRMVGTLHGKTGQRKVKLPISNIEAFDPFKNAIAFKRGTATVFVSSAPEFRVYEETFGPYRNCKVELPTAAAILLICKGKAEILEQNV